MWLPCKSAAFIFIENITTVTANSILQIDNEVVPTNQYTAICQKMSNDETEKIWPFS